MAAKGKFRLTELAVLSGCTGKSSADLLTDVLRQIDSWQNGNGVQRDENLLVGLSEPDDTAVYRVTDDLATIATVDFFAPLVDDPCSYGEISAANAMSDVYAMGGEVVFALNVAAFPVDMETVVITEILRGGAMKVSEAGGVIAGGHTIIDAEPKYGLCVFGTVHPERVFKKGGARPGDLLYLTKPLGTGLITTAAKFEEAEEEHLAAAIDCMVELNRDASRLVRESAVNAMTDVTGFGILGHSYEMAAAGGVGFRIDSSRVPILPGAMTYAYRGVVTGGGSRNRRYLADKVAISDKVSRELDHILHDPQTSGGLLFTADPEDSDRVEERFRSTSLDLWRIGEVIDGQGVVVD